MQAQQVEENGGVNSTPISGSRYELWWSNLIADRKKIILYSFALGLVVILAIFVLTLALADNQQGEGECALQINQPTLGPPRAVIAISELGQKWALAKLSAFIHVKNSGYLPLDFGQLAYETVDSKMIFVDKCVNVSVILRGPEENVFTIQDLKWTFAHASQAKTDQIEPYEYCISTRPQSLGTFPPSKRYSCQELQTFECLKPGPDYKPQPVASLIVESFELQLGGDSSKYSRGEFSEPIYNLSCPTH